MRKKIFTIILLFFLTSSNIYSQDIKTGDYIEFGKYYKEPILWRVIEEESDRISLFSDKILAIKSFDPNSFRESDQERLVWANSYIRRYLNGDDGFLKDDNFTKDEKKFILVTQVKNLLLPGQQEDAIGGSQYFYDYYSPIDISFEEGADLASRSFYNYSYDKVYLLDFEEIYRLDRELGYRPGGLKYSAGIPTEIARVTGPDNDMNKYSKTLPYWLRSRRGLNGAYLVDTVFDDYPSTNLRMTHVNSMEGIRPAMTLSKGVVSYLQGEGSLENPFSFKGIEKPLDKSFILGKTSFPIYLNGRLINLAAYLKDGSHYVRLRDLAQILNNTNGSFGLDYSQESRKIIMRRGGKYRSDNLNYLAPDQAQGLFIYSDILVDQAVYFLKGINIEGYNYYKLRDIMEILRVRVEWDNEARTVNLYTS